MTVIGQDTLRAARRGAGAVYRVVVTHRPELACRACEGTIVQSPAPPRQIEGGIPTEALVISLTLMVLSQTCALFPAAPMILGGSVVGAPR